MNTKSKNRWRYFVGGVGIGLMSPIYIIAAKVKGEDVGEYIEKKLDQLENRLKDC